jgi:MFS family permease
MNDRTPPAGTASKRIVTAYVTTNALFTLSASLIWSINTLFLLSAGLSLPMVFVVNATFTAAQMICEIPTGVIADTLGRKTSFLLSVGTLIVSTILYVLSAQLHWGVPGFVIASVIIGLGFTFQTGAVDAWMVDALTETGFDGPREEAISRVFALSGGVSGAALVVGPLLGGLLGQISLYLPYYLRAGALGLTFVAVAVMMREIGFTPRKLTRHTFVAETRAVAGAGIAHGWHSRAVRPLMWVSLVQGLFFAYGFYALSPYLLQLLAKDYVWLTGAVFSAFSLAGIFGNLSIRWGIMRRADGSPRSAPKALAVMATATAVMVGAIGVVGVYAVRVSGSGLTPFLAVAALWAAIGYLSGVSAPVASSYINQHIPSAQRATVLSLSALFGDAGGVVGQPAFGYAAAGFGIAPTWVVSGFILLLAAPLYRMSGRASDAEGTPSTATDFAPELVTELCPEQIVAVRPEREH